MPSVVLRPRALVDLADIWAFIAEDSEKHADRFAALIDSQFRALARQPLIGRSRPELATDLRSFPVGRKSSSMCRLPRESRSSGFCTARGTSIQSCTTRSREIPAFGACSGRTSREEVRRLISLSDTKKNHDKDDHVAGCVHEPCPKAALVPIPVR
jgi:plasmid stabilization system protein ParE